MLKRERLLNFRVNEAEADVIYLLASGEGMNMSEWIRTLIRRELDSLDLGGIDNE